MALSGLSTIIIAGRRWDDRREVRAASVSASWVLNGVGRLSATIAARDAYLLGVSTFLGCWIRWDHATMGTWGGVIEDVNVSFGAGTVELVAGSFTTALKKRRTRKSDRTISASPGSLVYRAFGDIGARDLPFDSIQCDTGGDPVTIQWRAADLFSVVTSLANANASQFDAPLDPDDWTVDFAFRTQIGADKTGEVLRIAGSQIADGSAVPSIANIVNDILAVSADQQWDEALTLPVIDVDSIQLYGRRQDTALYYGFASTAALYTRAKIELKATSLVQTPVSFQLSDREPLLAEIRQGDTIRVMSSSANAEWIVSVTGRSVDAESGQATLVGDAVAAT